MALDRVPRLARPGRRRHLIRKIEKLTAEQAALLPQFRAQWLQWGINTDRADRAKAEAAVLAMRARIGTTKRPIFVWCESPATVALAVHFLKSEPFKKWADSIPDTLESSLWSSLESSLGSSLGSSLRSSLWSSLGSSLESSLESILGNFWWGQHDSYWIAFYLFCRDVVGVKYAAQKSSDLDLWRDVSQSCCWWQCYENYVIISDRPTVCCMDDRDVLHCQSGPALAFADGWMVHAWHGVSVPAEWIEDKLSLTPSVALRQTNTEQRRAACEILGWDSILRDLKAKTIERDHDPEIGELLEVELPYAGRERFLRVRCGTGRTFAIPVPPDMETALEANAWTYDLPTDLLKMKENRT